MAEKLLSSETTSASSAETSSTKKEKASSSKNQKASTKDYEVTMEVDDDFKYIKCDYFSLIKENQYYTAVYCS